MQTFVSPRHDESCRKTALLNRRDGSGEQSYGNGSVVGVVRVTVQSRRVALMLAALVVVGATGCGLSSQSPPKAPVESATEPSSAAVSIIKPQRGAIPLSVRQPGSIQAFEQTHIVAKIPGYVRKWNVDID